MIDVIYVPDGNTIVIRNNGKGLSLTPDEARKLLVDLSSALAMTSAPQQKENNE